MKLDDQRMVPWQGLDDTIVKVLYVDDEPSMLDISREFLEMEGDIVVDTSTSVKKALEDSACRRYDVIISDYRMPDGDGIEFLKMLREKGADTPFIIFTGQGREEVVVDALNNGADFYMQKGGNPLVQFEELRNVILQLAQRSRAEKALKEREEILTLITDNMQDIVIRADSEDIIDYISPSIEATGFTPAEVIGRKILDFVHPDDVERVVEDADMAIARREEATFEYRQLNKDGTYTWSEARGKYLIYDDGNILMSIFSARNVEDRKRFEEELSLINKRYQDILNGGNVIVLGLDQGGRLTWMNDFAQKFFGYSEDEIVGKPAVGTILPEVEEGTGRDLRKMLDEIVLPKDNMIANVNQNMKKNGERAWVAWTNRLMDMGDGRKEVLCTGVDITGHHRMEPPDESSALPQGVLDSIPVATLVISQDGTVQACNGQFMDMWELPDGCHGMPLSDLLDIMLPKLEDRDGARSRLSRLAAGDSDEERFDMTLKNGTKVKFVAGTSWLNDRSAVRAWSFLEQTDPVGAGDAIAESRSKLRAVFDTDAIGIVVVDVEGNIVKVNQAFCRMMGYGEGELKGKNYMDFVPPEDMEGDERSYDEWLVRHGDIHSLEGRLLTNSGKIIWVRVTGSAVRDDSGRLKFGIGFIQDITEQKEIMESLRRSEARYRDLVRNLPNSMILLYDRDLRLTLAEGVGLKAMGLEASSMEGRMIDEVFQTGPFSLDLGAYEKDAPGETSVSTVDYMGHTYRLFFRPLLSDSGEVYGRMIMGHDVTDLKRTEEELRRLNRSLRILTVGDQAKSQASDENELYHMVCSKLISASGHALACIALAEEGEWPRVVASCGIEIVDGAELLSLDRGLVSREALRTGKPAWKNELSTSYSDRGAAGTERVRSCASLPINQHGRTVGVLTLFSSEPNSFDPEEIGLFTKVANDISRGMTAFRDHADSLHTHRLLSRRGRQMQRLNLSSRNLTSILDEQEILRTLVRTTCDLLDCEACMMGTVSDGRIAFKEMSRQGVIVPVDLSLSLKEGGLGRALMSMKPYVSSRSEGGEYRNLAVVPMLGKDGKLAGALWAQDKRRGDFDPWDLSLMEPLAASTSVALNNADVVHRLKSREDELEQVNKKLELIGRISRHDLLNHIATLSGYLELARGRATDDTLGYLEKASASAENIAKHLAFARDYSEMGKSSPEWVPLKEAVKRGASTVHLENVRLEIEDDDVELYADRMVEKVFHNLLDNSLRHGEVTAIKVSVEEGPQGLSIVYTDDGKGIPQERKDEIFELAQNHRGLYLTKEVLALTGIRITERGEMGKGARFDIIVPRGNYRRRGGMERLVMNRPRPDPQV